MNRWIFHIDVNAFYASIEINNHPEYQGKPVVVCSDRQKAVITTANYIARSFGIESAMPLAIARKKCPDLIITGLNFDEYKRVSQQFIQTCKKYSEICEQASIDECYLDVSETIKKYERPLDLAIEIQKDIQQSLNLDISIGIASNMFLAKMASNMKKPNGLTIIRDNEVQSKLWPLPIEKMHGIGNKTVVLLKNIGIHTIEDLATQSLEDITMIFKNHSQEVIDKANGMDEREVETESFFKSISQSSTLIKVTNDTQEIQTTLKQCCIDLSNRLKTKKLALKQLTLSIKDHDNQSYTRSVMLDKNVYEAEDIYEQALMIFDDHFSDWDIKNIGIGSNKVVDSNQNIKQLTLFKE